MAEAKKAEASKKKAEAKKPADDVPCDERVAKAKKEGFEEGKKSAATVAEGEKVLKK